MESGRAQLREQEAPGVGGGGEAVEAQGGRPVGRSRLEVRELHPVGRHEPLFHGDSTYRPRPGYRGKVNVTFYGVRGSCPCSGDRYRRYGGNTSCLVIDIEGDEPLIVDMGTGARALGDVLLKEARAVGAPLHATALLTHLHFDHILGVPFFGPLHDPGARLIMYGPVQPKGSLKD